MPRLPLICRDSFRGDCEQSGSAGRGFTRGDTSEVDTAKTVQVGLTWLGLFGFVCSFVGWLVRFFFFNLELPESLSPQSAAFAVYLCKSP